MKYSPILQECFEKSRLQTAIVSGDSAPLPYFGDGNDRAWYFAHRDGDRADVFLRDDIGAFGQKADDLLLELDGANDIVLYVNSRGGDSEVSLQLYRELSGRVSKAIVTRAYSAAMTVICAAKEIEIFSDGQMMAHAARLFRFGTSDELRQSADYLDNIKGQVLEIIAARVNPQHRPEVVSWFSGTRDVFLSASQAISFGLADRVVEPRPAAASGEPTASPCAAVISDEREFFMRLSGARGLRVKNRNKFIEQFARWATFNTAEKE